MGSDSSSFKDVNIHIPPPPDILAVAAEASDERDPVAVIQEAVNAHHHEMVEIIKSLLAKQVDTAIPVKESNTSKAEDRLLAMQALDRYASGLKDVRRFDPNTKKGNYTGLVVLLTEHHMIQKVGEVSFVIHDRHKIEAEHKANINDRLQIKYNAGRVFVNASLRAAAVNTVATHELAGNEQKELKNMMDSKQLSKDINPDREAE